jgi:protein-disulfide isomerase
VLGTEPQIIESYVNNGDVRIVYWPMLDHANASLNAHAASDCIGRQDVDAFWEAHDLFYANQGELYGADRDYFVNAAVSLGVDQATFESCYDNGEGHATVTALDSLRREKGIFNRPTFEIENQQLLGSQPFSTFMNFIDAFLNA